MIVLATRRFGPGNHLLALFFEDWGGAGQISEALGQDRCRSSLPINRYFFCFFAASLSPPISSIGFGCYTLDQGHGRQGLRHEDAEGARVAEPRWRFSPDTPGRTVPRVCCPLTQRVLAARGYPTWQALRREVC